MEVEGILLKVSRSEGTVKEEAITMLRREVFMITFLIWTKEMMKNTVRMEDDHTGAVLKPPPMRVPRARST